MPNNSKNSNYSYNSSDYEYIDYFNNKSYNSN